MNLINCPDCNHQVSSSAPACPSCGCPISDPGLTNVCINCGRAGTYSKGSTTCGEYLLVLIGMMFFLLPGLLLLVIFHSQNRCSYCGCKGQPVERARWQMKIERSKARKLKDAEMRKTESERKEMREYEAKRRRKELKAKAFEKAIRLRNAQKEIVVRFYRQSRNRIHRLQTILKSRKDRLSLSNHASRISVSLVETKCPQCNSILRVAPSLIGSSGTCRHCGKRVTLGSS